MAHWPVRACIVATAAAALWLAAGGGASASEIPIRIPYVPAETLPATQIPSDPGSAVSIRIDPGDNEAPDPSPRLILRIGQ